MGEALIAKLCVAHVVKEGSRRHVFSYALYEGTLSGEFAATWCSEPFCEHNVSAVHAVQRAGLDPARCCPSVALADWLKPDEGRAALRPSPEVEAHE